MGYIKRNVLYVDDDQAARVLLQAILRQAGYVVETAHDAFEALDLLHKYAFDIILLDIMMPKMNGFDFLKRIRTSEATKTLPVVILSQMDDKKSVQRCLELGADDYLIKPPERKILMEKMQRILGTRPRFAEVAFGENEARSQGSLTLSCQILSIGETGMVMRAPLALDKYEAYKVALPLLETIGLRNPNLRIIQVQEENNSYLIYFSYVGLSDEDVQKLRSWVITEKLTRKSA